MDAKPDSKQVRRGIQRRVNSTQLRVRGVRHDPPDAKKIAKALVELARQQRADEPGRRHDPNAVSGESPPLPPLPADCSASLRMPTRRGWAGVLGADVGLLGVAGLRVLVGGGTVPMTGMQRPSR